jgi:hypothetical protein
MATPTTYLSGTIATLLSTELNALANNASVLGGSAYSGAGGYLQAEVEFAGTFAANPTANTGIAVWFLRAIDGTNFEDGSATVTPGRGPDVVLSVTAGQAATRSARRCVLPAGPFNVLAKNDGTGQALTATGHTLKILPATFQQG